jgi:Porin PorA
VRRGAGYVLVVLGLFLVFLSPLSAFYITPRVKKLPLDIYDRNISRGTGTYLNPGAGFIDVGPVQLIDDHIVKGDVDAGADHVAVWDSFDSTYDPVNHHQLSYSIDRYALDRKSAITVACCGQSLKHVGSLVLTFPLGTEKRSYPWYDTTAKAAFPMLYRGITHLEGMDLYHFHQRIAPMLINHLTLPGKLVGLPDQPSVRLDWYYSADTDVLVEPHTGAPVKGTQVADQWLQDSSGVRRLTVAKTDFAQDAATVKNLADQAKSLAQQLQLVQFYLPYFGWIIGLILVVIGLVLLGTFRRRPTRASTAPSEATATTAPTPSA